MGSFRQKWCKSEHITNWTLQADTYKRSLFGEHKIQNLGQYRQTQKKRRKSVNIQEVETPGRHSREGALLSTG